MAQARHACDRCGQVRYEKWLRSFGCDHPGCALLHWVCRSKRSCDIRARDRRRAARVAATADAG